MVLLAAIGDITRFPHARQLVGYAGLGARVYDSAETHHGGGITKQGRRDLRAALIEAAWVAVLHNAYWKARFEKLCRRLGKEKAIVAIARQMLVVVWHLWHDHELDRHMDTVTLARKLMTWAEAGGRAMRQGLTAPQFVRLQLDYLGVGQELTELRYGSHVYRLPPPGSVKIAAVVVANPLLLRWISAATIKTDGHDALKLARLLAAGLIPAVWVPPEPVRQLRALVSHRHRLIRQRTQARNRLHSVLQRHNLTPPTGEPFAAAHRAWWEQLSLEPLEKLLVTQNLQLLDALEPLLAQVEQQLYLASVQEPWVRQVPYLVQQTGIGVLTAMVLLAAIGDITRFPHARQLVG